MRTESSIGRGIIGVRAPTALSLTAIIVLALLLRLAWLAHTHTVPPILSDPQYYQATAQNLAEGRGFSVTMDQRGFAAGAGSEATAFWAPGYPMALAPLYKLFGSSLRVAKAFNAVVGALTVLPVFYLGRRLRSDAAGLLAGGLVAAAPSLVFWTSSLFSETLFTLGVASTLAIAAWAGDRRGIAACFVAGLVLAATAFVRSQGVLLVVPALVLMLRDADVRGIARAVAPMAAAIALLAVPWAVRNDIAMGRPYFIDDNLGYNLRLAHAPYADGSTLAPRDLWDERPGISFRRREAFFDGAGRSRALAYARAHAAREVALAAHRVGFLARSDAAESVRWAESLGLAAVAGHNAFVWLGDVCYYALAALAFASLVVVRRSREWLALWSTVGVWVALHLVFAGEPRYHVPMMPVLSVLAAGAVVSVWEVRRQRSAGDAAMADGAGAALQ